MSDICIKCDKCTNACPIVTVTKQERLWRIYFNEAINLWNCSSCFRCEENCPVNLSIRETLFEKRRHLKKTEFPPVFLRYFKNILETGNVFVTDDLVNERRFVLGLEPLDFVNLKADLKKLMGETK
ncbi:MAG: 4Fe-4S dicluster domain-containing protein [Candidatus Helarchaeota archaeon]